MYPIWTFLLLPYTRLEMPGWGKLLSLAKIKVPINDCRWSTAPTKTIRGKMHGYWMKLDLSDWSERYTYFLGRYYELEVQQLLSAILEPGDRFIDVGANIGMISMHAAHLVTETGKVDCFEPNPECVQAINDSLARNAISHVNVHPVGLSDSNGVLQLSLTSSHTGTATLAPVDGVTKSFDVQTLIGDDVVLSDPKRVKLIKIDVEGFELHVLKGLKRSLETFPLLITEFEESHFQRAGTSSSEIMEFLTGIGYKPYGILSRRKRKWKSYRLQLIPLMSNFKNRKVNDVLWVHAQNPFGSIIKKYILI